MKKKKIWTRWLPPIVYGYYYYLITSLRTWPRHFQRPTARCSGAEVDAVPNDLHQNIVREYARIQIILFLHTKIQKKDKNRREGKGRSRCWLGDVLECRTKHLAARMIRKKVFWENIHFGRVVWYGVNRMTILFSKASILPSSRYSIHPFLQTILVENIQGKSSDDLCILVCLYPSSMVEELSSRSSS